MKEYNAREHAKEVALHQKNEIAVGDFFPHVELVRLTRTGLQHAVGTLPNIQGHRIDRRTTQKIT